MNTRDLLAWIRAGLVVLFPLNWLWKAHFFDSRFIEGNLVNQIGVNFSGSNKMDAICKNVVAKEADQSSELGWLGRLCHELTVEAYEERSRKNKMTGEWLIFSKYQGKNYYLCVAKHSMSKEEDQNIRDFIREICEYEYPFLLLEKAL